MFYAYSSRYQQSFAAFETREEAIAFLLDGDENYYLENGRITMIGSPDYTLAVFNGASEAIDFLKGGDEYSLPSTLRALADAFEAAQDD